MAEISIENVINVTITPTPQGISEKNVNSLALFTTEVPNNIDPYDIYLSASSVATDYGSGSVTAAMANAVFSQTPNILSGSGRLVIIPMVGAVSATSGHMTTADISANVTNIIGVSAGDLKVTLNGIALNLTNLNFTRATTITDIAAILQNSLPNAIVTTNGTTTITITSKKVGSTSDVTISAVSGGMGVDLSGNGYFKSSTSSHVAGVNSTGETLTQAIVRTEAAVSYAGVMSNLNLEDSAISAVATTIEARDMMFLQHVCSSEDIMGIGKTISDAGDTRVRILLYTPDQASANLMKAAYAGRGFSTDFTGSNTSTTLNLKNLVTITPDPGITQTMYTQCETYGLDIYVPYSGVNGGSIVSTGGNDYFDNPYSDLALKFALQAAGFNYLAQTSTKVPETESGMNGLKSAYSKIMQQFVNNGELAPGTWNSSETFGDPAIFLQNISTRGFYIYSLPVAQQSAADRAQRKAPLVQIAAKRAGAIQSSAVLVIINA